MYEPGIDPYVNKAGGALIFYRTSTKLKGDISDDHKIHKVIETERVDGTKVTFKGGKKMVYLSIVDERWTKSLFRISASRYTRCGEGYYP